MDKPGKPPAHLSAAAKKWFRAVADEYVLESSAEWQLLIEAASCLDRIAQCRERIAADGLTTGTASGGCKPHPCLGAERDFRTLFARLCRELRLCDATDETKLPRHEIR